MLIKSVLKKLAEQNNLIETVVEKKLNHYLKYVHTFIDNLFNKFIRQDESRIEKNSASELKAIQTFGEKGEIYSLCFLRDGRLVLSINSKIVVYNKNTFESDIVILNNSKAYTVCGLKNGNLAACISGDIPIYKIDGNNYKILLTILPHEFEIFKIIELEDGRLCSAGFNINIWNNSYELIGTLPSEKFKVKSVIEINDYIIFSGYHEGIKIWNKYTFEFIHAYSSLRCYWNNCLSKLKENTIIFGGSGEIVIIDVSSFQIRSLQVKKMETICCICVLREDKILLGSIGGYIYFFDSLSNQITFTKKIFDATYISCIIKDEDNKIFLSSRDYIKTYMLD